MIFFKLSITKIISHKIMKEKINLSHSYCHKGIKDNTEQFFCFPFKIKNSTEKKYNIYINHKSSLETLLNLIKSFQMDYLSQYSQKKITKIKNNYYYH
jgi:hypothetical protein